MYEKKTEDVRCNVARRFDVLGGKWNLMLVCALSDGGPVRYGELRQRMNGISDMALSNALRALQREGVILREAYNEVPPRVEYTLTDQGRELIAVVKTACHWCAAHPAGQDPADPGCWRLRQQAAEQE